MARSLTRLYPHLCSTGTNSEWNPTSANFSGPSCGIFFSGFISMSRTGTPRRASCQAHSLPASPAPRTVTVCMAYSFAALFFAVVFLAVLLPDALLFLDADFAVVFFGALFFAPSLFSSGFFFL